MLCYQSCPHSTTGWRYGNSEWELLALSLIDLDLSSNISPNSIWSLSV